MSYLSPAAGAPAPTQSAVVVPIAAAEPVVGGLRERFDKAAGWGVPAHITVIYPFAPPDQLTGQLITDLESIIATVAAFDCRFEHTNWFGPDLLWLAPHPAQPFLDLTSAVWTAFPRHPPYAGAHPEVVPHLTIADSRLADPEAMRAAERAVRPHLPVVIRIDHVLLIAGSPGPRSWRTVYRFPLANGADQ